MKTKPTYEEITTKVNALEALLASKENVIAAKDEELKCKDEELRRKDEELRRKQERIIFLMRMLFGSKSDKLAAHKHEAVDPDQPGLFDELFNEAYDERAAQIEQTAREIKAEAENRRKKAKATPKRPVKYQYYGLEEKRIEQLPEGVDLDKCDKIGQDETRILHRQPAKVWVEIIVRPIFRLKADKNNPNPGIYQAPAPKAIIGGNHVDADLLAQLVVDKYVYHIPEYRQVKQYADMGVKLPTSTINDWMHAVAAKLYPLYESLGEQIRERRYLQIDEVPWRIADSPGKCRKGYAWQFLDATPDSRGLYFYYHKGSRAGTIPRAQLKGYRGAIQTDGYKVYDYFEQQSDVTLLGCMAHVRRKFIEAQSSHPQQAKIAIEYIQLLYQLEANLRAHNATPEQIQAERQAKAIPIMDTMEKWMQAASATCTPSDLLGKALDYAYKLWPRLRRYALDGIYRIDNNAVERGQRPSVMGRKNYLFSKNDRGASDNAVFYSLLESCQIVGVNQLQWLTHTLRNLTADLTEEQIIELLPYNYKKSHQ